jgi:putative FmdB family regulatory protein
LPIYEYECDACAKRFEVIQRFSDEPISRCRECSGPVHRVLSPPALIFKGSGWYVTDHPSKDRTEAMKKEKDQAKAPDEGAKKDSKTPAAEQKVSAASERS